MADPRIGTQATPDKRRVWPELTLAGNRVDRSHAATFRGIGNGQFVIIDHALPATFDVEVEIAKLTGVKAPTKKAE